MKSSEIKNPIELKEYCRPSINIVLLDEILSNIVSESEWDPDDPGDMAPRRSNPIFDDL